LLGWKFLIKIARQEENKQTVAVDCKREKYYYKVATKNFSFL